MAGDPVEAEMTPTLRRSLEWATASDAAPDPAMDPCTAELREAWIAWTRLLERGESSLGPHSTPLACLPSRPRRRTRFGLALVAVLVAVASGTIWWMPGPRPADVPFARPEATVQEGDGAMVASRGSPSQNGKGNESSIASPADSKLAWEDTADLDIAELSDRLIGIQQSWRVRLDVADLVWCGIAQIRSEIDSEPL